MIDVKLYTRPKENPGTPLPGRGFANSLSSRTGSASKSKEADHAQSSYDLDADSPANNRFIRKDRTDRTEHSLEVGQKLKVGESVELGDFVPGSKGAMLEFTDPASPESESQTPAQSYLELDRLYVRVKAFFETLTVVNAEALAGKQYITPGGGVKVVSVEENPTEYLCYYLQTQEGEDKQTKIKAGDMCVCSSFNAGEGTHEKVGNRHYWRYVTAVESDATADASGNAYGCIHLSKTDCEAGSDVPEPGDTIVQKGNRTDKDRQSVMVFSTIDSDAPCIHLYQGVSSYTLEDRETVAFGYSEGRAYFRCLGDTYIGAPDEKTFIRYNAAEKKMEVKAALSVLSTIAGSGKDGNPDMNLLEYLKSVYTDQAKEITDKVKALEDSRKEIDEKLKKAGEEADAAKKKLAEWAADGVISPLEKQSVKDEIQRVESDRDYITGQASVYGVSVSAYTTACNTYLSALRALSADTPECIAIPTTFATTQDVYYTRRTEALSALDAAMRAYAAQVAANSVKTLEYLKAALEDTTETHGGLVLATLIQTGQTVNGVRKIMAGMNGAVIPSAGGRTIASWWGGQMTDLFDSSDKRITSVAATAAKALVRMDGSAYFSGGNVGFKADGSGWLGNETTGILFNANGQMTFGSGVVFGGQTSEKMEQSINSIMNFQTNLQNLLVPVKDGKEISWASAKTADSIKAKAGFWSESFISAMGLNAGSGTASVALRGLSDVSLDSLTTGQTIVWDGSKWVNRNAATGTGTMDETALGQYLSSKGYATQKWVEDWVTGKKYLTTQSLAAYLKVDGTNGTAAGLSTMINKLTTGSSTPEDADYYVCQYAGGSTSTTTYHRRPVSCLWEYIKGKANSVYAAKDHTHTIANVTGLQTALDDKATKDHTHAAYTHPMATATTITAANGNVLSAITVNNLGHVTSVSSKTLAAADIPGLAISKITNLQTTLDGKAANGHTHNAIEQIDTRSTNNTPSDYKRQLTFHFKQNSTDGLSSGGTWHSVLHIGQWGDSSGGYCKQMAFGDNGNIYLRIGLSGGTTWNDWKTVAFTDSNVDSATRLQTSQTLWGRPFDGTDNVSGALESVTTITASGLIKTTAGMEATDTIKSTTGFYTQGYVTSRVTTSDIRLKRDVTDFRLPLETLAAAPSKQWRWKSDGTPDMGGIAQWWAERYPRLAPTGAHGYRLLLHDKIAYLGVITCATEIEKLRAENNRLRQRIEKLETHAL